MDYFKVIIKHPKVLPQYKFNTLLLLKDLMKAKPSALVAYVPRKLLSRLYQLASSAAGDQCLLAIDPSADPQWSAHFHQLNLETIGSWGQVFKDVHPQYFQVASKLLAMQRLPVQEKYFDFPSADEPAELAPKFSGAGYLSRGVSEEPVQLTG